LDETLIQALLAEGFVVWSCRDVPRHALGTEGTLGSHWASPTQQVDGMAVAVACRQLVDWAYVVVFVWVSKTGRELHRHHWRACSARAQCARTRSIPMSTVLFLHSRVWLGSTNSTHAASSSLKVTSGRKQWCSGRIQRHTTTIKNACTHTDMHEKDGSKYKHPFLLTNCARAMPTSVHPVFLHPLGIYWICSLVPTATTTAAAGTIEIGTPNCTWQSRLLVCTKWSSAVLYAC
jgi:hypothetical protein